MKYYAVTEDPNELFHYGVKGMKWGQHIFGDKPKSPGYKRAASKLRTSLKLGIRKPKSATPKRTSAQKSIDRQKKEAFKYEKAVQKAQQRIQKAEFKANRYALRKAAIQQRHIAKEAKKAFKAEKHFDKYLQQAREGRLRYGKLSEEQVRRVTDRLNTEMNARRLGSTEKAKFGRRVREAVREGTIEGIKVGTTAGIKEVAIAKVQNRLRNRKVLNKKAKLAAKRQREANRKTHKELRQEVRDDLYEQQVEAGMRVWQRRPRTIAGATKALSKAKARNNLRQDLYEKQLREGVSGWSRLRPRTSSSAGKALKALGGSTEQKQKKLNPNNNTAPKTQNPITKAWQAQKRVRITFNNIPVGSKTKAQTIIRTTGVTEKGRTKMSSNTAMHKGVVRVTSMGKIRPVSESQLYGRKRRR